MKYTYAFYSARFTTTKRIVFLFFLVLCVFARRRMPCLLWWTRWNWIWKCNALILVVASHTVASVEKWWSIQTKLDLTLFQNFAIQLDSLFSDVLILNLNFLGLGNFLIDSNSIVLNEIQEHNFKSPKFHNLSIGKSSGRNAQQMALWIFGDRFLWR